jgi:hypothetical protein
MGVAMRGANLLPVKVRAMRERKRNSTLSAALDRQPFQLESRVLSGLEGFGKLSQVVLRNCHLSIRPQTIKKP